MMSVLTYLLLYLFVGCIVSGVCFTVNENRGNTFREEDGLFVLLFYPFLLVYLTGFYLMKFIFYIIKITLDKRLLM